jgi:hypothetical protein
MTEHKEPGQGLEPDKDGLHTVSTPEHVFVPGVGFTKAPTVASISFGEEEKILDMLRSKGFSEEAIKAFRSGKPIQMLMQDTPFGTNIVSETWEGKEEEEKGL